jgi:TolA-binding protein
MKTAERHHLKTNEFAERVAGATQFWNTHRSKVTTGAAVALAVIVATGAFVGYRQQRSAKAGAALSEAEAIASAPVAPAGTPATGALPAGTYATAEARDQAAVEKFLAAATAYGSTPAGLAARYRGAMLLAQLGRRSDAEREFKAVADKDSGLYGRTARLALAELQVQGGQYDAAIQTFRDTLARTDSDLPADGLLMQLGRTYLLAGKKAEALQSFTRVIDEHPQSVYLAEARREAEGLKSASAGKS